MTEPASSYRHILRATSLMGVASGANIVFQIVRVKVLAVLLGPAGMGLFGMYQSILNTASSLASLGISFSAVRQIAEARGSDDSRRIGEVMYVFRLLTLVLGALGATAVFGLREQIARWTFGSTTQATMIGWLAIGVFIVVASQSLGALLQAYRRIGDQARLQIWSGALSTAVAIAAIAWLGEDGVIIFVVAMPFVVTLLAWWYARRIGLTIRRVAWGRVAAEARRMLSLGVMVMAATALQAWAQLALRSRITQDLGLEAAGLFQAAWALSFVYMGFVLEAMGRDYYPHLTEQVADRQKSAQLMREQINVAIVLIGPLVVASVAFAPLLIDVLYARSFQAAVPMVQWMGLGNLIKAVSWPLGFIVLAQARSGLFFALEALWLAVFLGVAWLFLDVIGLPAVGIAFVTAYALYFTVLYAVSRSLTDFHFDQTNRRLLLRYGALAIAVYLSAQYDVAFGYGVGILGLAATLLYSYMKLSQMLGKDLLRLVHEKLRK